MSSHNYSIDQALHSHFPIRLLDLFSLSTSTSQYLFCNNRSNWVTINILPDDALLEIFNFYLVEEPRTEKWHTLVHVCRRWGSVVFASPRRLDLRILCKASTEVKTLHIWPILPINVWAGPTTWQGVDNIVSALEHSDRIYQVLLDNLPSSLLERIATVMQVPFPALTELRLVLPQVTRPCQGFPKDFWEDLLHVYNPVKSPVSQFREYGKFFRLPITSSTCVLKISLIQGTFHPRRWLLPSPRPPISKN